MTRRFRITALYPDRLNIYADRGNLLVLRQRGERRGIDVTITNIGLGDELQAGATDLYYLGGGQDRDQRRCAVDLQRHRQLLADEADRGVVVLGICGGYQLLGHRYESAAGAIEGVGLLDVTTATADQPRLVGDIVIQPESASNGGDRRLVGFENHQGRTSLGPGTRPLGTVVTGHGNNGEDRTEGAISGTVIGTYLHGPLLAKNVWFADHLLGMAIGEELEPIADRFEEAVHHHAITKAGTSRPS